MILVAISSIAIPTISSSLDRTKAKQYKAKVKLVESAAKLYVSDHRNSVSGGSCIILVSTLVDENYIDGNEDIPGSTCVLYEDYSKKFEYMSKKEDCIPENRCGLYREDLY